MVKRKTFLAVIGWNVLAVVSFLLIFVAVDRHSEAFAFLGWLGTLMSGYYVGLKVGKGEVEKDSLADRFGC